MKSGNKTDKKKMNTSQIAKIRFVKSVSKKVLVFMVSTELLARNKNSLVLSTNDGLENLNFVIGIKIPYSNKIVPTSIFQPDMEHRDFVSGRADPYSVVEIQNYAGLYKHGFCLLVHCHPGDGPDAIHFSAVDRRTYTRWEQFYPQLIGLIYDQSGRYMRFFSVTKKEFRIELIGGGVEHVEGIDDEYTYCFRE